MTHDLANLVDGAAAVDPRAAHPDAYQFRRVAGAVGRGEDRVLGDDAAPAEVETVGLEGYLPGVLLNGCWFSTDYPTLRR